MDTGKLIDFKKELLNRLFKFSIEIIKLASNLPKTPAGYAIASQVIRSGTSIGANCEEAQDSVSRKEFLNKINISLKEARETEYWLRIIETIYSVEYNQDIGQLLAENSEIIAILTSSVRKLKNTI